MADLLTAAIHALRQLSSAVNVTAEELCDAVWLYRQGVGEGVSAATEHASPFTDTSASAGSATGSPGNSPYDQGTVPGWLPTDVTDTPGARESSSRIAVRGAVALPKARELSRALRPLRFDPLRTHRAPRINEEATAERIATTGLRDIAWLTSRRRRLDLDLVLDLGGSGPLWRELAIEMRAMLEVQGAFRSVRFWDLDSDSAALPLRHAHASGRRRSTVIYPDSVICQAPRKPLVMVLTDGTGRAWQSQEVVAPLRRWAAHGTVLLVQLLPARMWERTSLPALPVTFLPSSDGYHSGRRIDIGNAELYETGIMRRELPAATAIPVIGLSAAWFCSWLPLLRGIQAGPVPGYALIVPPVPREAPAAPEAESSRPGATPSAGEGHAVPAMTLSAEPGPVSAETRVLQFKLSATPAAFRLAKLLSTTRIDVAVMRKVRSELLPDSDADIMAEVMLGGLVYWTTAAGTLAPSDTLHLQWHDGVRALLQERAVGIAEYERDEALVQRAIAADRGTGAVIPVVVEGAPGTARVTGTDPSRANAVWVAAVVNTVPEVTEHPASQPEPPPGKVVRVGLFGSTASGRTTFLAILGMMFSDWTDVRPGEQWRVIAATELTKVVVAARGSSLTGESQFPAPTALTENSAPVEFRLERRRRGRGRRGWLPPDPLANVTIVLQDRAGGQYVGQERSREAARYLAESDALVYFFDPTYDMDPHKDHSSDFFNAVETDLGMNAARAGTLYEGRIPQDVAVCLPKLDDQRVFDLANEYECVEIDQFSGLPWVPPRKARQLFEIITLEQRSRESDYLRMRLPRAFHPRRISYHAFSSVGFWADEDGVLDPENVCNVVEVQVPGPFGDVEEKRVRGDIRPVHVLDPLISLIERVLKRTGQ